VTDHAQDPIRLRERDRALRLDVQLFLQTDLELTRDDDVRRLLRGHIALGDLDGGIDLCGCFGVDTARGVVFDTDVPFRSTSVARSGAASSRNRLLLMPDFHAPLGEDGLVSE